MNREISEMRQVIEKLVPLLASRSIKVTQQGSQAYVRMNPVTKVPEIVNIPNISDNASPEFIRAIRGFIDHEVAHVLLTDFNVYGGGPKAHELRDPKVKILINLHNIIEDTMIEREMCKLFPGSAQNMSELRKWFLVNVTDKALKEARNDNDRMSYLVVPIMRALAGHEEMAEWMDANGYWKLPIVKQLTDQLSKKFLDDIKTCSTTAETLVLARELKEILYPPAPPAPPPPPPPKPEPQKSDEKPEEDEKEEGESQNKPEKEADEGDGDGERDHKESDDEADPEDEGEDGKGEPKDDEGEDDEDQDEGSAGEPDDEDEPGDEDDKDRAGGEADDEDGDRELDDEDPGEGTAPGDDGDGEDDAPDGDEASDDASDEDDEEGDSDDSGDDDGDGFSGDPSEDEQADDEDEDLSGSSASAGAGEDDEEDGEGEEDPADVTGFATEGDEGGGDDIDGDSDEESEAGGGVGNEVSKSLFDFDEDAFDEVDMSSQIAILISDEAVEAMQGSDYNVFTRDYDRIETLNPPEINGKWVPELEDRTREMTGRMRKDIERMMASQSHVIRTPGHRKGKLHAPSFHRLLRNDPRVFSQREEHHSKDTAVTLLIDNSGSMRAGRHGYGAVTNADLTRGVMNKAKLAMISAYALSATLESVKIAHEVMGFTTGSFATVEDADRCRRGVEEDLRKGVAYDRTTPIVMPIYKTFDERVNSIVKKRFAYMMNAQQGMSGNVDGESLLYAAERLMRRPENRKVMIVLSDGQPAGSARCGPHLSFVTRDLEKHGIDLVGIGIMDASVSKYYPKYAVLRNLEDLPGQVMGEIRKLLS